MKVIISQFLLVVAIVIVLNASIRPSSIANSEFTISEASLVTEVPHPMSIQDKKLTKRRFSSKFIGRERQGKRLHEKHATFQIVAERIHVRLPKNKRVMIALENLTLERIHKYIGRVEEKQTWEIEGQITEYEGQNYILISRAIVNSLDLN